MTEGANREQLLRIQRTFDAVASGAAAARSGPSFAGSSASAGAGGFFAPGDEPGGGGFLPEDDGPVASTSTSMGGFVIDESDGSERRRLPLSRVARALRQLSIPRSNEVTKVFEDAASSDEEAAEKTVSKDRFVQICSVLVRQDDDDSSDSNDEQDDDDDDDEAMSGQSDYKDEDGDERVRPAPSRRVTRNKSKKDPTLLVEPRKLSDSEAEDESGTDDEGPGSPSSKSGSARKQATTKKKRKRRKDDLDLDSKQAIREVFELFFSANPSGTPAARGDKVIGMGELRNVAGVLKEKLTDDEMLEMLEYANDGRPVDLQAFERLCQEL